MGKDKSHFPDFVVLYEFESLGMASQGGESTAKLDHFNF